MLRCPNHEISKKILFNNFYARLPHHDKETLDSSSGGCFTTKYVNSKWNLIERIQHNAKDWEIDKGKEHGMNFEYDCIKSFGETDVFHELSAKFGLPSKIVFNFLKSFAAHINVPKEKWVKYNDPLKDACKENIISNRELQVHTVTFCLY
jgi:hypothetical protein